jgi:hypothetical protein
MNHSQEPMALLIFFALCGLAVLGFVFFFKLDFAAKRTVARSALPFLLFSVAAVFGLLCLADGLRVAHVATPPDGDSWLLTLALLHPIREAPHGAPFSGAPPHHQEPRRDRGGAQHDQRADEEHRA